MLLGVATGAAWLRNRDRSLAFLALAIVLLSLVAGFSRIQTWLGISHPLLNDIDVLVFLGSGYALLRFRDYFMPLSRRWHSLVLAAVIVVGGLFLLTLLLAVGTWRRLAVIVTSFTAAHRLTRTRTWNSALRASSALARTQ